MLIRIDQSGHVEVVDGGSGPAVVVDTDGQLHRSRDHHPRRRGPGRGAVALAVLRRPACLTAR